MTVPVVAVCNCANPGTVQQTECNLVCPLTDGCWTAESAEVNGQLLAAVLQTDSYLQLYCKRTFTCSCTANGQLLAAVLQTDSYFAAVMQTDSYLQLYCKPSVHNPLLW